MFKRLGLFICGILACSTLVSCGESSLGGGIGEFTTVVASASASTNRLESDVLTGNTCSTTGSTGGTFSTDNVDFNFVSRPQFSTGALNLVISKITVHYQPVNPATTPPLQDYIVSTNQIIPPTGNAVVVPVPVVPDNTKYALVTRTTQNLNLCSADYFEYYVTVYFEVSEPGGNGTIRNIPASLNVAIADRS